MSATALAPLTEPDLEAIIRSAALDAVRRIQDALRFCPHSHVRGLVRALREARDLVKKEATQDVAAPEVLPDARHFSFRDEEGTTFVLEVPGHGGSTVKPRWLPDEEAAAFAAAEEGHRTTGPPSAAAHGSTPQPVNDPSDP